MNEILTTPSHDVTSHRWCIQVDNLRCRDDRQRHALAEAGALVFDVLRLWLKIITPDAHVVEPVGMPVRQILFIRRSDMRRFSQVWGGKMISNLRSDHTLPHRHG